VLAAVLTILVGTNVMVRFGPAHAGLVIGPVVAVSLVALARRHGLSWDDLGLGRRSWSRGARYAAMAIGLVAAVYLAGAALPATRIAFLDTRYHLAPGPAVLTALVVIPLGTVLVEEIAFRGVLAGLLRHHHGWWWATGTSSALFGLWHILPSLHLNRHNRAAGAILGTGSAGQVLVILGAVAFTALAGVVLCELRRRSGSLVASAGLHWATNAVGVLVAAALWTTHP
jgi:membrane protease YdiL (CAAX protease family)